MNKELILANLAKRPVRTSVSILAVSVEVALILVIVGLVTGINTENGLRIQGVGSEIMIQPPGSSLALGLNSSVMPVEMADRLLEDERVRAVAPIVTQLNTQGRFDLVYGVDPVSFDAVSGGLTFIAGGLFEDQDDIVIDDVYAEAKSVNVGDEISLLNHGFEVTGIVEHGKGARLFMDLEVAQNMLGSPGNASIFFVKLFSEEDTDAVIASLQELLPTYPITPMRDMVSLMANMSMPGLDAFLTVIMSIAVFIGLLVIFLSMYTTISERTREIGILRSLGASKGFVVRMILTETLWLCVVGVFVGIALSFATAASVPLFFPSLTILILPEWVVRATILAILSGVLGALYPSFRAAGHDPVEALAYE